MTFLIVHKTRHGWRDSSPGIAWDSEPDAAAAVPDLVAVHGGPAGRYRVVERHIAARQLDMVA